MDLISDELLESAPSHRGGGHGLHIDTAVIVQTSKLALQCCVLIAGVLVALRLPAGHGADDAGGVNTAHPLRRAPVRQNEHIAGRRLEDVLGFAKRGRGRGAPVPGVPGGTARRAGDGGYHPRGVDPPNGVVQRVGDEYRAQRANGDGRGAVEQG